MTRTEIYDALYSKDEIYRPPIEENSAFLEVTHGCSYGRCTFCDFSKDRFKVVPLEEVAYKCHLLSQVIDYNPSLHLLGCNPLCLSTDHLLQVLNYVQQNLLSVKRISMYARAEDVNRKSEAELRALRIAGLSDLHIGLESGSDTVLRLHNKGETVAQMMAAFDKLHRHGLNYHLTWIPGLGGRSYSQEHAMKTSLLLSNLSPVSVWGMALKCWPGTPLEDMIRKDIFQPLSYREILMEERMLISQTEIKTLCLYVDSTVLGQYTLMGILPNGKRTMLDKIDSLLK